MSTRTLLRFRLMPVALVLSALSVTGLLLPTVYGAQAVALDRAIRDYRMPDQIQWKDAEKGIKVATLFGDPSKPGFYVQLEKREANVWSKPRYYDNDRFATVLDGTLWVGTGRFDERRTMPVKAGSFVRDVAGGVHFDGTKADGVTLYYVGLGPATPHHAEPRTNATLAAGEGEIDTAITQVQHVSGMPEKSFYLYGDQSKPGVYVQYLVRQPNAWSRLHYHPMDRFIMVFGGTMWIGTGKSHDKEKTVGIPRGGFVRDLAQGVHYDGSKDGPLWIQISGIGPASSTDVEPTK